jgi:hypothetical protein
MTTAPVLPQDLTPTPEPSPAPPKLISVKKLEANRQNAKKSTGPRTLEGKQRSRLNALKHGILAKAVVIHGGPGKEKRGEFDELLTEFWQHYSPQGPVEEMLVERMTTLKWRLARVYRSERGEIMSNHEIHPSESDCLPNANVSDRLARYETMLERAFYRALTELERLQQSRRTAPPTSREGTPRSPRHEAANMQEKDLRNEANRCKGLAPDRFAAQGPLSMG